MSCQIQAKFPPFPPLLVFFFFSQGAYPGTTCLTKVPRAFASNPGTCHRRFIPPLFFRPPTPAFFHFSFLCTTSNHRLCLAIAFLHHRPTHTPPSTFTIELRERERYIYTGLNASFVSFLQFFFFSGGKGSIRNRKVNVAMFERFRSLFLFFPIFIFYFFGYLLNYSVNRWMRKKI